MWHQPFGGDDWMCFGGPAPKAPVFYISLPSAVSLVDEQTLYVSVGLCCILCNADMVTCLHHSMPRGGLRRPLADADPGCSVLSKIQVS